MKKLMVVVWMIVNVFIATAAATLVWSEMSQRTEQKGFWRQVFEQVANYTIERQLSPIILRMNQQMRPLTANDVMVYRRQLGPYEQQKRALEQRYNRAMKQTTFIDKKRLLERERQKNLAELQRIYKDDRYVKQKISYDYYVKRDALIYARQAKLPRAVDDVISFELFSEKAASGTVHHYRRTGELLFSERVVGDGRQHYYSPVVKTGLAVGRISVQ